MAKKFFESLRADEKLSGEVVWRIEDDATIDPVFQAEFILARVATVGHSIHRDRGKISLYTALVPNFHFLEHKGYSELIKQAAANSTSFGSLRPQIFWAGSTTGVPCRGQRTCDDTCQDLQRYTLVKLSQGMKWLNFRLTSAIQWCQGNEAELYALNMLSIRSNEFEWMQYRGIIDVDGNVDAWGSRWRFATNSVVFKVKSDYVNHYSRALVDGVHFIEISETMADLELKTAIITRNDTATLTYLENISKNARQTISEFTLDSASVLAAQALGNFFTSPQKL